MNHLTIRYNPEDEYHGEIFARVESDGFAGRGSAWFSLEQLKAFSNSLSQYPLTESLLLEGGYWDDDRIKEAHVSIRIEPNGMLGELQLTAMLTDPMHVLKRDGLKQQVTARFLVSYNDLIRFQASFNAMVEGKRSEAILESSPR